MIKITAAFYTAINLKQKYSHISILFHSISVYKIITTLVTIMMLCNNESVHNHKKYNYSVFQSFTTFPTSSIANNRPKPFVQDK